ncbi:hypothetical protein N9322_01365 [bacterium]|jgi:hypothetical protein|nr:hypothetical protein [bacterium]|tara:strand:- start:7085 stop:7786 length:702 start_codon:yes stop_codon:yes gene_type:complete
MGRKPLTKQYFGPPQEEAVRIFLTASTWDEKNVVYNEFLRDPLIKMIDSIIRRYKLYRPNMEFTDIHTDTLSFLVTKMEKFKPAKGKKAYSYFGTICKNYLMGQIMKDNRDRNRKISYEDISYSLEQNEKFSYTIFDGDVEVETVMVALVEELKKFTSESRLNVNEEKIGYCLIDVFENYESIFIAGKGNKFNKNIILYQLREMSGLTTKEIRSALKPFKSLYKEIVEKLVNR